MALTDLAIDDEGDLVLDDRGNLVLVTGREVAVQYIKIALATQLGTYRFDKSFGSQLNELIGQTKLSNSQKTTLAKLYTTHCLTSIPFVKSVESVTAEYTRIEPNKITLNIKCTIYTDDELSKITRANIEFSVGSAV